MDVKEYDEIVRFHESKDSEQRNWPQDLLGQKMAKMLKGLIDRNLSQIQPTNLHSHEQTKQPSDQTLKCYASSNSFNEVKSVTKIASEELEFTICDISYTSCEAENEPMIQTNSGTQHFVMKSDFQQLLNGECFGDNKRMAILCIEYHPCLSIFDLSSVVTINDKTEQFILNQCSTEVLLDIKASIEKFTSNSSETVKTYKSLLPKFNTPLPEEISPVDPLPESIRRQGDQHLTFEDFVHSCHDYELNKSYSALMQFSTFYMELPLMTDMEATEQTSLPGMFCTQS
ncbi:hypothetical protein EMCRGX_G032707 [Ephydatia muelleri]